MGGSEPCGQQTAENPARRGHTEAPDLPSTAWCGGTRMHPWDPQHGARAITDLKDIPRY